MSSLRTVPVAAALLVLLAAPEALGNRIPSPTPTPTAPPASPAEVAARALSRGEALLAKGEAAEEAGKADRARKRFEAAERQFQTAAENAPSAAAYNGLGYSLRKIGRYDDALAAYDRALQIDPRFAQAIEYRAEAHLALGRLDEVRSAYMQLFQNARPHADELLAAVEAWLENGGSSSVAPTELEEFTAWVHERSQLAGQTSALGGAPASEGW